MGTRRGFRRRGLVLVGDIFSQGIQELFHLFVVSLPDNVGEITQLGIDELELPDRVLVEHDFRE